MKQAFLSGDAFLADVWAAPAGEDLFHAWWLGQSGFLIKWNEHYFLFDPYLSDSLTKKYNGTEKPHVRITERVVNPDQLEFIEFVTSTHNHTDHLDAETLQSLRWTSPDIKLVLPSANMDFAAERLHCGQDWFIGMNDGDTAEIGAFTIHAVPAAHEHLETDKNGRHVYLGFIVKFGKWTLYHSGDTVRYDGMLEQLQKFNIDAAFLPINGSKPERRVPGNLWGHEAAQLAKEAEIGLVIPCHYDMFEFNTVTPDEFITEAEKIGQPYRVLQNGERHTFS